MPTRIKPDNVSTITAQVAGRNMISPHFARVTITGQLLSSYQFTGFDQWFRLFLPTGERGELKTLPDLSRLSTLTYLVTPPGRRPLIRNYTTATYRPDGGVYSSQPELDIDIFVDDHHSGPGSTWATTAKIGSDIGLLDEGMIYNPPAGEGPLVLAGDESALPAIAGILRDSDPATTGAVFIELANSADARELDAPAGMSVNWLERGRGDAKRTAGDLMVQGVRDHLTGVSANDLRYAYLAGPAPAVTGLRRHIVKELGVNKQRVSFTGYWR